MKKINRKNCIIGAGLLLMGIMVMTVSAACGDKREKAESEKLKTKNIVNGSELIAETEKVSKVENSKDNEKIQQNTEPAGQINTEQIKPDKTDIQSSPSTENEKKNEIKNDDEKNNNDEKKSDVMEEENPDYHASGGELDVSDNPADEYNADEPDNSTHDQDADEPDNDTENYETDDDGNRSGDGNGSGDAKEEKPKVDAGWIYYVSSAKNGMNNEQKAYFDALVGKWTRKEITDADMSDEFLHTFDEWGFDTWTAGVTSDERCLFNSVEAIPDYSEMVAESKGFYNFIGLYTEGEYDDKGYLICYYWEAGTM